MHITDPIADLLTRVRNASSARHTTVDIPASNMKKAIAQILVDEGYVKAMNVVDDNKQGVITLTLKYNEDKTPLSRVCVEYLSPAFAFIPAAKRCPRYSAVSARSSFPPPRVL